MKFTRLTGPVGNVEGLDRLQRLGKIRLGIKKKSKNSGKEYPAETDYFLCPPEVEEIFGVNPKVLRGMFPSNNPEEVYQEKLAMYGQTTGLKCQGNGVVAMRRTETGEWVERKCPCDFLKSKDNPSGSCTPQAHLMVMLPEVKRGMWGYYQITTHSKYARGGILGSLKHMLAMIGRVGFVPITIYREAQDIAYEGKKKVHHILKFVPDLTTPQIAEMRSKPDLLVLPGSCAVEEPLDENPQDDPPDVLVDDEEEDEAEQTIDAEKIAHMDDAELQRVQEQLNKRRELRSQKPPQQTPAASTGQIAPAGKPAKAEAPKTNGHVLIAQGTWRDMIAYMDSHPDLTTLKQDWKQNNHVENVMGLNAVGQQALLAHMRTAVGASFPY